ncbi:hypothetical protein, partial [Plasmodium yoelii yoelii]
MAFFQFRKIKEIITKFFNHFIYFIATLSLLSLYYSFYYCSY